MIWLAALGYVAVAAGFYTLMTKTAWVAPEPVEFQVVSGETQAETYERAA
ncbi:MAG: hypothetical protein R2688_02905 [Fimbriimonadaceae bacterium]